VLPNVLDGHHRHPTAAMASAYSWRN
jgi:hypothetical protein